MSDEPAPTAAEPPPSWCAAVVARYPGPAMLLAATADGWVAGGTVQDANAQARQLQDHDDGAWLQDIRGWLAEAVAATQDGALGQGEEPQGVCITRVPGAGAGGGDAFIEWRPLPAAAHQLVLLGRDITAERRLRSALQESRQRFKDLVEVAADFAWETDSDGLFTFVSAAGALGYSAEALAGSDPRDLLPPELQREATPSPFTATEPVEDADLWLQRADGEAACLQVSARPVLDARRRWCGARGVCRDITAQRRRDAEMSRLRNRDRVLMYIVRAARDAVDPEQVVTGAAEHIGRALAASGCTIYGVAEAGQFVEVARYGPAPPGAAAQVLATLGPDRPTAAEAGGKNEGLLAASTRHRGHINGAVLVWRTGDAGTWMPEDRELLGQVADQLGIAQAQRIYQRHLRRLSETDELTGLYNRRAFFDRLGAALRDHGGTTAALVYVDMDNFKPVNDIRGHKLGDLVLEKVGRSLYTQASEPGDFAARLGGDEFALWLDNADSDRAAAVAAALVRGGQELAAYSGQADRPLSLSVGVALHRLGESLESLVERGDQAMYRAKEAGRSAPGQGGFAVEDQPARVGDGAR